MEVIRRGCDVRTLREPPIDGRKVTQHLVLHLVEALGAILAAGRL
jgi:hypothetical protein